MAPTALQKAERERDAIKTTLGFVETIVADHINNPLTDDDVIHHLSIVATAQEEAMTTYKAICVAAPADMDPYNQEHVKLLKHISALQRELKALKRALMATAPPPPSAAAAASTADDIRLPKLQLPTFSGNLQDWMAFRDIFVTTVHDNPKLSNAQKLTYLKTSLTGEAARQIKSLSITNANYDIAWPQITARYNNDRELLFSILQRFVGQPVIISGSPSSLRSLIDVSTECGRSLEILAQPVDYWDSIFLFHMFQKLDTATKQLWEQTLKDSCIPNLRSFLEFLEQRARALAASGSSNRTSRSEDNSTRNVKSHHTQASPSCSMCSGSDHRIYQCSKFFSMTTQERAAFVKKEALCTNCLRFGHAVGKCSNIGRCQICRNKHHSLLHHRAGTNGTSDQPQPLVLTCCSKDKMEFPQTILATAMVILLDRCGNQHTFRALLDGGSTASFITESCISKLGLLRSKVEADVSGLAAKHVGTIRHASTVVIQPHFKSPNSYSVNCLLMPQITGQLPIQRCDPAGWPHLSDLQLADPTYYQPSKIDLLLGSDIFWNILLDGKRNATSGSPVAINTTLGWLVAGRTAATSSKVTAHIAEITLDERLRQFWEIESVPVARRHTPEETLCEKHFEDTHRRDDTGRFIVKLPFKSPSVTLGESRDIAIHRFKALERRFRIQPDTQQEYINFMREYLTLGHMEVVSAPEVHKPINPVCYIPHHFVRKESSTTTKLRVVFDASTRTSSGKSLNDALMVGPTLQDTLVSILMRFRTHVVAFTADIAKMYRQIRVDKADSDMQRIVWREDPAQPLQDFRLLTVTYGTASAPYLATKALQQLAIQETEAFPQAAAVLLKDFYIDDLMAGARNTEEALALQTQLLELTARGGHELRKWSSNSVPVLEAVPAQMRESNTLLQIDTDPTIKALGVFWNPAEDVFIFKLTPDNREDLANLTKRMLLSEIAKVFDPLGWLAPIIIRAKIIMQQTWALQLGWDETLPTTVREEWNTFRTNLPSIEELIITRCILPAHAITTNLCGFCDASEKAYAGAVYLCVYFADRPPSISLITSKTRVAPAKTISVPRLELCGAVLLAQLMTTVDASLQITIDNTYNFTDSTVVLAWIRSQPSRWKTFVANRVAEIQHHLPADNWGHVSGVDNPADCASRGIDPSELRHHPLWWNGPAWLQNSTYNLHSAPVEESDVVLAEEKTVVSCGHITSLQNTLLLSYSSFRKLRRITAWILRFTFNCRMRPPRSGTLTPGEIDEATLALVKAVQAECFPAEIRCLKEQKPLPTRSPIISLTPFLDSLSILRVGGRLSNAYLSTNRKNPILLPRHHKFNELLIRSLHLEHQHAGRDVILSILQQTYWIVRGKDAVRHQIRKCVTCTRLKGATLLQMMGDLPADRVNPAPAFSKCGIDYGGPFLMKPILKRSRVTIKAYLALFVCFTTRAIHLEVVTELSTAAFLAAFKRFISRRGRPTDVYSDCGTNFVGAAKELKEMFELQKSTSHNEVLANECSAMGIEWHFNPPGAPHFGGLWEAGIKSAKFHLYRIMGTTRLTFKELTTITIQIEATLNSRPLTPVSTNPNDLSALTPGHFLIGRPLTALPEPDILHEKPARLTRWQLLQKISQDFWKRWSNEYLSRLQQRPKWLQRKANIDIGDMVLVKDDNQPPLKWILGRIINLHPGKDGLVRVATLKTSNGELKRPIVKLCLLPIDHSDSSYTTENSREDFNKTEDAPLMP